MAQMASFIHLLAAAANGLLILEGQNTNCTDVFYVWVCIAYQLEQVLANLSLDVSQYWASVTKAYNHCFNQMMMESSHCVFLLAYYLHPCEFHIFLKMYWLMLYIQYTDTVVVYNWSCHLRLLLKGNSWTSANFQHSVAFCCRLCLKALKESSFISRTQVQRLFHS